MPHEKIIKTLTDALRESGVAEGHVTLEFPAELSHGDFATGAALQYAKQAGMKSRELAEKIVAGLGDIEGVAKVEIAGPGFINFRLSSEAVARELEAARAKPEAWGTNLSLERKKVIVEYTDPNPFKEFHIGHLVPNALGESLARLFEFTGATVRRANYQGDVGIHVAKSLFIQLEKGVTDPTIEDLALAYPEGSRRYDEDPAAKAAIDVLNKTIYEKKDARVNALYEKGRALSLSHFENIYRILGTKFDHYFFESETGPRGLKVVRGHSEIFEESEGAVIFRGERYGLHTRVFVNKFGLPTYEAKDLGLVELKRETCPFDTSVTVTANEQAEYFKVVLKAIELVFPDLRAAITVKTNGLLRFAEGKMSSRLGNIITGEALINDLVEKARERASESRATDVQELSRYVAVAAIKYQILRQAFGKDIVFNRERSLSLEGDSGPYLQYAHARACAVLEKAHTQGVTPRLGASQCTFELARRIIRFPDIVRRAQETLEPHHIATYLIEVAATFNAWYAQEQILDGTPAASHKLALTDAVRVTIKNGLYLLGIPAPEKM